MIKVEARKGEINIIAIEGKVYEIIAELCSMVRGVCTEFWEDEENGKELTEVMISLVCDALKAVRPE